MTPTVRAIYGALGFVLCVISASGVSTWVGHADGLTVSAVVALTTIVPSLPGSYWRC